MTFKKAAIYHFTAGSEKRPIVYQKQLHILEEFAQSLGYTVAEIFCDMSLVWSEHTEFGRFLSCADQFDALITKDFYHISKNTMQCMRTMQDLLQKGIPVHSIENGTFTFEDIPFTDPLKVVTYTTHWGEPNELKQVISVKNDIMKLFTDKKTPWILTDQYYDETERQRDGEQVHLQEMILNKDKYDLLLVHNLNDIHWRTANFCKIREALQLDIYSLQEGFLKYRRNTQ